MAGTILIVEDDAGLQEVLTDILEFEGYDVVVARDGIDALNQLTALKPAVILLDLMMPRMDGFSFAEEMERRGLRSSIPIVVLTADGRAEQKAAQLGADGYLEKPFTMPSLLAEIERFVPSGQE